jgi:hypothetical protein
MKRFRPLGSASLAAIAVLVIATPVAVGGLSATGSPPGLPTNDATVTVDPANAAQVLQSMGVTVPAQSCLAQPKPPSCPTVSKIVIQPFTTGTGEFRLGPEPASPAAGAASA